MIVRERSENRSQSSQGFLHTETTQALRGAYKLRYLVPRTQGRRHLKAYCVDLLVLSFSLDPSIERPTHSCDWLGVSDSTCIFPFQAPESRHQRGLRNIPR